MDVTCCKKKRSPMKGGLENLLRLLLAWRTGLGAYLGATRPSLAGDPEGMSAMA